MDQLEEDKEVVNICEKSFQYRSKLQGEEHEVIFYYIELKGSLAETCFPMLYCFKSVANFCQSFSE